MLICSTSHSSHGMALNRKRITELQSVVCYMRSHTVGCHPTLVNATRLNLSQTDRYSIYLPRRNERLSSSWCWIYTVTQPFDSDSTGSRTHDLAIVSETPCRYNTKPPNHVTHIYLTCAELWCWGSRLQGTPGGDRSTHSLRLLDGTELYTDCRLSTFEIVSLHHPRNYIHQWTCLRVHCWSY